ncbi:hypothetical protein [Paenibacillus endoradicis]|uniref:hypothetical protein n=1 Tax=Paenibacillus endoradicis TaxID=2972487 RepID=UPI002158ED38|nr:hypothetical protein [Paenibacillus endoradicis]MCR8655843.1 hypothetical protein [Paenibacillus endoradicis]MCR8658169.1 hypothetical protein [Paenibacillus endoradicis]
MENNIKNKVERVIAKISNRDHYLLKNDLNERTIAHKFATYLQEEFNDYDVDCEYNKKVDEDNGSKNIYILKVECEKLRKKTRNEILINDEEYSKFSIYPDIIVHHRGNNDNNLLIIEIKKSTNAIDRKFDYKKLQCYTDKSPYNKLHYKYGLFIEFKTGNLELTTPELIWYRDGDEYI